MYKHGMYNTPTYRSWNRMIQRCTNSNYDRYYSYGHKGITVCARWKVFANFLVDMGIRPEGTTLDRIDSTGNYELSNCRWASTSVQNSNRRNKLDITYKGRTQSIPVWAKELNLSEAMLRSRIRRKWSLERLFVPRQH